MRLTKELLLRVTREEVDRRVRQNRDLLAAYLVGSMADGEPNLGGAVDIDLVLVDYGVRQPTREIVELNPTVHLDIMHQPPAPYRAPRQLRGDAWMGSDLFDCHILHDPQHFLDFAQAGVRAQFDRPETVWQRVNSQLSQARAAWRDLGMGTIEGEGLQRQRYWQAVEAAANALLLLNGPPAAGRRFFYAVRSRLTNAGLETLANGLSGLFGVRHLESQPVQVSLDVWHTALKDLTAEQLPQDLSAPRQAYYQAGVRGLIEEGQPEAAAWLLGKLWVDLDAAGLPGGDQGRELFGLHTGAFNERLKGLDVFLDQLEEKLESWAHSNGVTIY